MPDIVVNTVVQGLSGSCQPEPRGTRLVLLRYLLTSECNCLASAMVNIGLYNVHLVNCGCSQVLGGANAEVISEFQDRRAQGTYA